MSEPVYQIFKTRFDWSQDMPAEDREWGPGWTKGLRPLRHWNGTDFFTMPKENTTLEKIEADAAEWIKAYFERNPQPGVEDLKIKCHYVRSETWCLSWFSHFTWDIGQTDEEALRSFCEFVERTETANRREGKYENGFWREPYCLMDAEIRGRWFGWAGSGAPGSDRTPPPCRCDGCKKQGVIRIMH